jgi:hypothetical protein
MEDKQSVTRQAFTPSDNTATTPYEGPKIHQTQAKLAKGLQTCQYIQST